MALRGSLVDTVPADRRVRRTVGAAGRPDIVHGQRHLARRVDHDVRLAQPVGEPARSRMLTRVPGAHPIARTTLRSATRPLLSTALTTYTMSTGRVEPESNAGMGRGARPRPDEPVPACRAWPVR